MCCHFKSNACFEYLVFQQSHPDVCSNTCPSQASLSAGLGARSTLDREFDRTFEKDFSRHLDSDLTFSSGLGARSALSDLEHDLKFSSRGRSPLTTTTGHSGSSSTYKAEKYSSSVSSANGGLPHR